MINKDLKNYPYGRKQYKCGIKNAKCLVIIMILTIPIILTISIILTATLPEKDLDTSISPDMQSYLEMTHDEITDYDIE